jgi:hypothetical protein
MCEFCGGDYENEDSLQAHIKVTHPPDEDSDTDDEVSYQVLILSSWGSEVTRTKKIYFVSAN